MKTMRRFLERENGIDAVLEVPIPEEMLASANCKNNSCSWLSKKSCICTKLGVLSSISVFGSRAAEIQFMLELFGAPLIPLPIRTVNINDNIIGCNIRSSMAKYIVKQYIGAAGGEKTLNSIDSMYATGKVKMAATEFVSGETEVKLQGPGETGGFVLWQKRPDLWSLELVVSGNKISAGSNGKVAWRHHSYTSRGPPFPLRRSLQGLDPRSTANLFSNSICIAERTINDEDCFVLKLEAGPRSSRNVEIMKHTIKGCFSQRSGLLIQLEDSQLLRLIGNDDFWETKMESLIQDYRTVEGVNIAHSGRTCVSVFRFGDNSRLRMEETWSVEEVDFNIQGLSIDSFNIISYPPSVPENHV